MTNVSALLKKIRQSKEYQEIIKKMISSFKQQENNLREEEKFILRDIKKEIGFYIENCNNNEEFEYIITSFEIPVIQYFLVINIESLINREKGQCSFSSMRMKRFKKRLEETLVELLGIPVTVSVDKIK